MAFVWLFTLFTRPESERAYFSFLPLCKVIKTFSSLHQGLFVEKQLFFASKNSLAKKPFPPLLRLGHTTTHKDKKGVFGSGRVCMVFWGRRRKGKLRCLPSLKNFFPPTPVLCVCAEKETTFPPSEVLALSTPPKLHNQQLRPTKEDGARILKWPKTRLVCAYTVFLLLFERTPESIF